MAIRLENAFAVESTPAQSWAALLNMPTVVSCMPGAELVETVDDDHWLVSLAVKLGPMSLVFDAQLERELADPVARRIVMVSKATERKGRGGASARVESIIEPDGGGSRVSITTDVNLSGSAAQFGRPVVQDVSRQLTAKFATCLQSRLVDADPGSNDEAAASDGEPLAAPVAGPQAISGISLLLRALLSTVTRRLRRNR
jgi:carbon monoxide dehydrogenase subunit G